MHSNPALIPFPADPSLLPISRRKIMVLLAGCTAAWGLPVSAQSHAAGALRIPAATLSALVDVLIPADEFSPSASRLNVDGLLLQMAEHDPSLRNWLAQGLQWLNSQRTQNFAELTEAEQIKVVSTLANAPVRSFQRNFFEVVRYLTMAGYYAQPSTWTGLAIDRPPQPAGYLDFSA